jgi:hypothetical protein
MEELTLKVPGELRYHVVPGPSRKGGQPKYFLVCDREEVMGVTTIRRDRDAAQREVDALNAVAERDADPLAFSGDD